MGTQPKPGRPAAVSPDALRAQLGKILASPGFQRSQRLSRFLQFVIDAAADGDSGRVKEYAIGVEVFRRGEDFDPRTDPIVRVQAALLRSKLLEYYAHDGVLDPVVISIPKGGYAAVIVAAPERVRPDTHRTSVAVLPFVNMSQEADNEYFSDGLTEEIINALASVAGIKVVARTSVFRYKNQAQDIREIGAQLNVGTILEGSVRRAGTQLRITAQLINVQDGYHLWSHTYKRELHDIFAVQDEIANAVRDALVPHLGAAVSRTRHHEPAPLAHELYLRGRYAQSQLIGGSIQQAVGFFEQAIAADPQYARAYSGLADAWTLLAFWGVVRPHDAIPKARAAAARAVELNPSIPESHISLGSIQCCYDWDWEAGARSLRTALEIDPDLSIAHHAWANLVHLPRGQLSDAIAAQQRAIALDPMLPRPQATLTFLLGLAGRISEAERQHANTLAINPNFFFSNGVMALAYASNSRFNEAIAEIEKAVRASHGFPPVVAAKAYILAESGNHEAALASLQEVLAASSTVYVPAIDFAAIFSGLRNRDETLAWLRKASEEHSIQSFLLPCDSRFRWLENDPDFRQALARMSLPARC